MDIRLLVGRLRRFLLGLGSSPSDSPSGREGTLVERRVKGGRQGFVGALGAVMPLFVN